MEKQHLRAYLYIIFTVFLWATVEIVMKLIQNDSTPYIFNFFRFLVGGITLLIYAIFSKKTRSAWEFFKNYPHYHVPAAVIGLAGGLLLYCYGTSLTQASMAAAIISSNPILISIFMILAFGEKKSPGKIIGIILGFIGMLLIITEFKFSDFFKDEYIKGNLLVLAGTLFWTLDLIIGKLIMRRTESMESKLRVSSLDFNLVTFLVAAFAMAPYLIFSNERNIFVSQSTGTWLGLVYIGIFTTGIAYLFFFKGIEILEASKGSNFFYLKPVFATILAFFILNEIPSIFFYMGIIIEVFALILISNN